MGESQEGKVGSSSTATSEPPSYPQSEWNRRYGRVSGMGWPDMSGTVMVYV